MTAREALRPSWRCATASTGPRSRSLDIAEAGGRHSRPEKARYYAIAGGSATEVGRAHGGARDAAPRASASIRIGGRVGRAEYGPGLTPAHDLLMRGMGMSEGEIRLAWTMSYGAYAVCVSAPRLTLSARFLIAPTISFWARG